MAEEALFHHAQGLTPGVAALLCTKCLALTNTPSSEPD
jgi:hypothetical protein